MDLHVHTLLSACAEVEMQPDLIVARAAAEELDVIAICDHNSAENVEACVKASAGSSVKVLPGLECESREGVHVLTIFETSDQALAMQEWIWQALPDLENDEDHFGAQLVVDEHGGFVRYNTRLLATGADVSVEEISAKAHELGGLVIPAHVDKVFAGLFGVLGLMPTGMNADALELSMSSCSIEKKGEWGVGGSTGWVRSSDAHRLVEVGQAWTGVWIGKRSIKELRLAFGGIDGRRLEEG